MFNHCEWVRHGKGKALVFPAEFPIRALTEFQQKAEAPIKVQIKSFKELILANGDSPLVLKGVKLPTVTLTRELSAEELVDLTMEIGENLQIRTRGWQAFIEV